MTEPASISLHYHERTKYSPESIAANARSLDWNTQPAPFKDYPIGKILDLKPYLRAEVASANRPTSHFQWWQRLSQLLYLSYGATAVLRYAGGGVMYLRASPSAGGLYPAEVYLLSRGLWLDGQEVLGPGLYNYQVPTHSLVHFWEDSIWPQLQAGCCFHPALETTQLALATTAVFHRSAWRYEDRAYRRVFLDTGHLLGSIELACAINGFRPHLLGGFIDAALNQLLYLDADQESTITVIPLADLSDSQQYLSSGPTALASEVQVDYPVIPDGQLLSYLHRQTEIRACPIPAATAVASAELEQPDKYNFPFCLKVPTQSAAIDWGSGLGALATTVANRRSVRGAGYTGQPLTLEELRAILDFAYQPQNYQPQGLDPAPDYFELSLIETFVAVNNVEGLEEGCYYYAPQAQELRQIRFKNFRSEIHYLCLQQELGREAGAVIFQTADLRQAVSRYGERAYRYLHMDAGHLGQRLNLAAVRLSLGACGVGGFFDDQVNAVLGIPEDEAVLYITTLGRLAQQS
ncbi:SagB/ThcOx family dehydrogenase [Leptolyngbya sp. FACHB-261]|nr:SagB/ThcOx family dehydrogenase [Leptolyngbya sp. FACHB-261]